MINAKTKWRVVRESKDGKREASQGNEEETKEGDGVHDTGDVRWVKKSDEVRQVVVAGRSPKVFNEVESLLQKPWRLLLSLHFIRAVTISIRLTTWTVVHGRDTPWRTVRISIYQWTD